MNAPSARFVGLLLIAAAACQLGGCAGQQQGASKVEVALVPPGLKSPFHTQTRIGAERVAKEYGWTVTAQAPDKETDFNAQIGIVDGMIARKVKAISICAINDKAIGEAIVEANRKGIPIFVHNSLTPVALGKVTEYIGYNQFEGGRKCGLYAAKLLNGKGKVVILAGIPGFHNTQRTGGFKVAIKGYPGITVVQEQICDWLRERAVNVAAQALERTPDIDLFFGASDEMAIGAAIGAKEKGKKVFTIGIDGNEATLQEIESGRVTATLGVYPDQMGQTVIRQMKKVLGGETVPEFLETPGVMVDRATLADYRAGKLWSEPKAADGETVAGSTQP